MDGPQSRRTGVYVATDIWEGDVILDGPIQGWRAARERAKVIASVFEVMEG